MEKFTTKSGKCKHEINCENIKLKNEIIRRDLEEKEKLIQENIKLKLLLENNTQVIEYHKQNDIQSNTNQVIETQNNTQVIEKQQNINHIITQQNINQNIIINVHESENRSYITDEFMAECVKENIHGICNYIKKLHFDPDHPENHNIKFVDADHYEVLEKEKHSDEPFIKKHYVKCVEYMSNFLLTLKKDKVIEFHILPRVQTVFKEFFIKCKKNKNIEKQHIVDFVKNVLFPLNLSADLDEEDDCSEYDYDTSDEIAQKIYTLLKETIDTCLQDMVNV
jgi:hypothetical protein